MRNKSWSARPAVSDSDDLQRIKALPRRQPLDLASDEAAEITAYVDAQYRIHNLDCKCAHFAAADNTNRGCIKSLRPIQAQALLELEHCGGLFGAIGTGHGKTIINLLGMLALKVETAVLLCPPGLVQQLFADYAYLSQHYKVPSIVEIRGLSSVPRKILQKGMPTLYVVSYSTLSLQSSSDLLVQLNPDAVLADESDKLSDPKSATTRRFLRYMAARAVAGKPVAFGCWTGSPTNASIKDYAMLLAFALRDSAPIPLDAKVLEEWASALDPDGLPADPGALKQLCSSTEPVESGYGRRLRETAGVIITSEASATTACVIAAKRPPTIPAEIREMLREIRDRRRRPDGEELSDHREVAATACNVACGYHYYWEYPRNEPIVLRDEWFAARQAWNREVRDMTDRSLPHLDSPNLCYQAALRYLGGHKATEKHPIFKAASFERWHAVRELVRPVARTRRLHDFLVVDAAAWAAERGGIVWVDCMDLGQWISKVAGIPYYGGGKNAAAQITAAKGDTAICASLQSHGRGRDTLQYKFSSQLVVETPASIKNWEQLLGRLHRPGQESDVNTWVYTHTKELTAMVTKALIRGTYVNGTLNLPLRLSEVVGL